MKVCPYCGKRIRYNSLFSVKNKGSYKCDRCKKESKVKISSRMIILFIALCLIVTLVTIFWCATGNSNNIIGVIAVAILVLAFYFSTPVFLDFLPIKRYMNDIGNKRSYEEKINIENTESDFKFNREVFDKIKKQKELGILNYNDSDEISSSRERENFVPVIEDVKEGHISSSDGPLHKINRTPKQVEHKYEQVIEELQYDEEVKQYVPKKKRTSEGSKYTANRRF